MRPKHFHLPNAVRQRLRPSRILCRSPLPRTFPFIRPQQRTLLTAVTNSPTLLTQYGDDQPPPEVISTLVDAAFAWAEQGHRFKDPPTHAVVLVSKALIPRGKEEILQGLSKARRLAGINAVIGVVDTVAEGAKGVSVLLASRKEGVQIETLAGLPTKELRVGRWHAKDKDEQAPFNFDEVMASIRGGESMRPVEKNPFENPANDFIFALGEMESMNKQAAKINSRYPSADVMGITLALTPTINSQYTTLIHNGVLVPPNNIVLFRIPRQSKGRYISPKSEYNISWLNENVAPRITKLAGNIILELNNRPAMPYLLSLLPPQSKEEELNPLPLVARVPSLDQGSILYVNVLGGSRSKGGIALDPLVASGHVSPDLKIEFGQVRQAYLPTFRPPNNSVHIQLEVLSHLSRRFKPGWEEHEGSDRFMHVGFRRKQRWHGVPEFTYNRRPDYQGTQIGLFAAGSEGGFMVGQAGMVPWLNRIRGARTQVQVTAIKERQRLEPVILKPKQPIDPKAHLAEVERKKQVRAYLKANNMIVSKRVEFVTHNRWRTVSFLRRKEVPWRLKQGLEKQKRRRVKYKLDAERQLEKKERMKRRLEMEQVRDRLMAKGAQIGFKSFVPFAGARALLRGGKPPRKSWSRLAKGNQSIVEKHPQPAKPDGRAREGFDFSSVSGYVTNLMATDQPVHDLLESGEIRIRKLFNMGSRDLRGPRRFGFRSRRFWQETRPGGFRRGGHRPGGLSFWGEKGPGRGKRQESEGQVADNARSR